MARVALLAILLAGCPPTTGGACTTDGECGGEVCTRDEQCTPASQVRSVKITWTVGGLPANASRCASMPDLYVQVYGTLVGDQIGFAPVPCDQGVFNFDKLPKRFGTAELGPANGTGARVAIDAANGAHFDL